MLASVERRVRSPDRLEEDRGRTRACRGRRSSSRRRPPAPQHRLRSVARASSPDGSVVPRSTPPADCSTRPVASRPARRRPRSPRSPRSAPDSATEAPAAGRRGGRVAARRASDRRRTLPSDFDIFSPPCAWTIPWCIQWRANCLPSATACARSFSWCGKMRSCPPPCRSNPSPRRASDMTTHSVCQPGRPGPHGDSHEGSAGFAFFQRAKSNGDRFSSFTSTRAPDRSESRLWWASKAVVGHLGDREVDAVARLVGDAESHELGDEIHHLVDVRQWRAGSSSGGGSPGCPSPPPLGLVPLGYLRRRALLLARSGDDLVVDVGDVRDVVDLDARVLEVTAEHVVDERETAVTDVRRSVDGRTADVQTDPARFAGLELLGTTQGRVMKAQHGSTVLGLCRLPVCPIDPPWRASRIAGRHVGSSDGTYRFDRGTRPRGRVLDRHAAADGVRFAPRRPRLLLHPDRHHRPLPAHDGQGGLLPDRLGRQRPGHRAPGSGLLRGQLRPVTALRPGPRPTAAAGPA